MTQCMQRFTRLGACGLGSALAVACGALIAGAAMGSQVEEPSRCLDPDAPCDLRIRICPGSSVCPPRQWLCTRSSIDVCCPIVPGDPTSGTVCRCLGIDDPNTDGCVNP